MLSRKLSLRLGGIALAALSTTAIAEAEEYKLRIASGHAVAQPYVHLMTTMFVPEVTRRVGERTKHKLEFIEGYGGSMVKVADTLEGVQSGIIDIGAYCFCFEPSNLPLHAFQVMLPFNTMSPEISGKLARIVYDKVPFLAKTFEDKYSQQLIALIADNGYHLITTFDWNTVADLKGRKIAGAGLNLKWLDHAGAVGVQSSVPEAYTSMQTGVYQGFIMIPSVVANFKWHEVAKYYTEIGFGAITWHGMTISKARWSKLPKEIQDIILEVGREYERRTGTFNEENYPKQMAQIKAAGASVKVVPDSVRVEWAKSLEKWPQEKASELDGKGMPASEVLKLAVEEVEKLGHKWPVRYVIK
jgi:C4-dicarboxylate-binding protein DctP